MKIEGNGFVVTGGLGTIGASCVQGLVQKGGIVLVWDVLPSEKGQKLADAAGAAAYYQVDVSEEKSARAAITAGLDLLRQKGAKLVGAVHTAAVNRRVEWTNKMGHSIESFREKVAVNVTGTFIVDAVVSDAIQSQYPEAEEKLSRRVDEERGIIVNFASVAAKPYGRVLSYGPTKTAVIGITEAAADFLGPAGIRVCSLSPSIVDSALMIGKMDFYLAEVEHFATFPRRAAAPEEIWSGVQFLIENGMMTGFDLRVDGGWKLVTDWTEGHDPRTAAPGLE